MTVDDTNVRTQSLIKIQENIKYTSAVKTRLGITWTNESADGQAFLLQYLLHFITTK